MLDGGRCTATCRGDGGVSTPGHGRAERKGCRTGCAGKRAGVIVTTRVVGSTPQRRMSIDASRSAVHHSFSHVDQDMDDIKFTLADHAAEVVAQSWPLEYSSSGTVIHMTNGYTCTLVHLAHILPVNSARPRARTRSRSSLHYTALDLKPPT